LQLAAADPRDAICLQYLAEALWEDSQFEKAIDTFERLIEANPANTGVTDPTQLEHKPVSNLAKEHRWCSLYLHGQLLLPM